MSRADAATDAEPGHEEQIRETAVASEPTSGLRPHGSMVAGRYKLQAPLGQGGNGEVWRGEDLMSGAPVAVKLLQAGPGAEPARVRREVSAMRLLRLPGVVRLLDEGTDHGQPFLVMELVEGTPFPGEGAARTWAAIAAVTIALLETLARIHAAGVVHRDLKPANILVSAAGLPTVLDFGLSSGKRLGEGLTREGMVMGTPAYLAPEQVLGEPVTARTDLYALGLILYQALSGELPHHSDDLRALLMGRIARRVPPLRERAPDVPALVASAIDLLLSRMPDERPRSAADVLGMLRGHPLAELAGRSLPRFDGGAPVRILFELARAGRSADLVGPRGSGRSRCLREVSEALERDGQPVGWARPARHPFESLAGIVGALDDQRDKRLRELTQLVEARLAAALGDGLVLLVDDVDRLDRWSASALRRCRSAGAVLRALSPPESDEDARAETLPASRQGVSIISLAPLDEAALRPLFAGQERLFHLPSDAARILWARTEGLQARVAHEVTAWLRAGLARWDGEKLAVDRDALDRLEAGLRVATPWAPSDAPSSALPPYLEDLAAWLALAWPSTDPELLGPLIGLPVFRVEADIEELVQRGAARMLPDGRVELLAAAAQDDGWAPERRCAAHRVLAAALPMGSEGRLLHLLAGQEGEEATEAAREEATALAEEIALEAKVLARKLAREGRVGQAIAALGEGLLALRRDPEKPAGEERLLAAWIDIAVPTGTPEAKDRVLYEICRAQTPTDEIAGLEALVRASLAYHAGGERALTLLDATPPFSDLAMERVRQNLRVQAARRCSLEMEEKVLREVEAWASATEDSLTQARAAGWLGRLRYRQGRFEEAARLQAEAAAGETWGIALLNARLNGASALMEAFQLEEAAAWARTAREQAREYRHAYFEARAEWLVRAVAYRAGAALKPDLELVEAVAQLGIADLEAVVCLNEAAVAYRADERGAVTELAVRGIRIWSSIGDVWPAVLLRSLALAAGAELESPGEVEALAERAMQCPVQGVGLQALGLLARVAPGARPAWRRGALPLARRVPQRSRRLRMDVLSVEESLAALREPSAG